MDGYDPGFLGPDVALPLPPSVRPTTVLPYTHFTVVFEPARRLAASTAANLDGGAVRDLDRADDWHLDPRVPADEQAGPDVYARNDLDRGHLVRRRDPVWGDDGARANEDTFVYTNAAPQAAAFNQGENLWAGVEDHVLQYAEVNRLRVSVFTGPVFADDDPLYRGVRIPRLFWKVAAWATSGGADLAAAGFVLDQTPSLDRIDLESVGAGDPPPLGPFRTFQVPVAHIAALTDLDLGPLVAADRMPPVPSAVAEERGGWRELRTLADTML
ncbi:DNA/RNA non-specific endonuclease [Curtobacterium sp. 22159]|uniref:DNA/RNA non-specific endonuclease n=1 Tax=Curtobacterium sp. 22159 TaxID=3453882 RepID=UPI003F84BFA3